jgi:putative transposase
VFERYQRSEKALVAALAEMYIQGVSTRKVKEITEQLCGHEFSAATISQVTEKLDGELQKFARRSLEEEYPYLVVDARYEEVREDGVIASRAVQVAIGKGDAACWEWSWLSGKARAVGKSFWWG